MDCKTEDQQEREKEDLCGFKDSYWGNQYMLLQVKHLLILVKLQMMSFWNLMKRSQNF